MAHLTPAGSEMIASAAFTQAEIALFDGGEQVTQWEPYDITTNTAVRAPRRLHSGSVHLRTPDGTWAEWPANVVLDEGDTLGPPPPSKWFVADNRSW